MPVSDGKASVSYLVLLARQPDGALHRLDARRLLAPMPADYLWAVLGNQFGQSTAPTKEITFRKGFGSVRVPRVVPDAQSRRRADEWLSRRVHEQQPDATALVVRTQAAEFDLTLGRETSTKTADETVFILR